MTSLLPASRRRAIGSAESQRLALQREELRDAAAREPQKRRELRVDERLVLGGRLDLDDAAFAGEHEIRIGLGHGILGVVEIEHRRCLMNAARDGGDRIDQRYARDQLLLDELLEGLM